jgi:hypothetical protein
MGAWQKFPVQSFMTTLDRFSANLYSDGSEAANTSVCGETLLRQASLDGQTSQFKANSELALFDLKCVPRNSKRSGHRVYLLSV